MYRHLLVPLDGSELGIELVGQAVALAQSLSARISFFHVMPLGAASAHPTRALLAKAAAAARALGVPCSEIAVSAAWPGPAIVAAARGQACDLIVMASHGGRTRLDMALGSQTLAVLRGAGLPVLVVSVGEPGPAARAIARIRDEHRSLAAVLHAWQDHPDADAAARREVRRYLDGFSMPHETTLFRLLRKRTHQLDAELDELERLKQREPQLRAELEDALDRYCDFIWEYLGRKEGVVLPAAQRWLKPADWAALGESQPQAIEPVLAALTRKN